MIALVAIVAIVAIAVIVLWQNYLLDLNTERHHDVDPKTPDTGCSDDWWYGGDQRPSWPWTWNRRHSNYYYHPCIGWYPE